MFEFYLMGLVLVLAIGGIVALYSLEGACKEVDKWKKYHGDLSECYSKAIEAKQEQGKKLVVEIEARMASEDATNILASVLCDLVRKKRSKKKG